MNFKNISQVKHEQHPFHLVDKSPWPLVTSMALLFLTSSLVAFMHGITSYLSSLFGFILLLASAYRWFYDIVIESTFEGHHTLRVQQGLRYGMVLFILSEVMFFFSFFWAFFHSSLTPAVSIGCVWPPEGITTLDLWALPLANTVILLSSGVTVTWAHRAICGNNRKEAILGLFLTILLGAFFTVCQATEYINAPFTIKDSIYGSLFFMCTGFHGCHVIIGTIFLAVCLVRLVKYHFTVEHHFGFEAAAWYWHFVDVVWLFLFVTIYWWGS